MIWKNVGPTVCVLRGVSGAAKTRKELRAIKVAKEKIFFMMVVS